jgi:predicted GH43/DUF377 family glycosyl hydrolase
LRANRAYYAQGAFELFGARAQAIEFVSEPGWNVSNPSIYSHEDRVRCVVRTVNYNLVNGDYRTPAEDVVRDDSRWRGWKMIRTRNFLLDLDVNLKTTRTVEMVDTTGEARSSYPVHGFEDARLFAWRDKWWATATACDFTEEGRREIALLDIDEGGAIVRAEPLRGAWSARVQKNWMPFVVGGAAKFVYASHPTTIFDLVDGKESGHAIKTSDVTFDVHGRLRGGSQGVHVDEGWLFVVHDVSFPSSGRIYLHRFVLLDESLKLVSMSDLFYFEKLGVEFCAGLAPIGDKLVASYSVNDSSARLGVFDRGTVMSKLHKDFVI